MIRITVHRTNTVTRVVTTHTAGISITTGLQRDTQPIEEYVEENHNYYTNNNNRIHYPRNIFEYLSLQLEKFVICSMFLIVSLMIIFVYYFIQHLSHPIIHLK
ncbi:hypothetical protein ABK040_013869 [Willaertia magna]